MRYRRAKIPAGLIAVVFVIALLASGTDDDANPARQPKPGAERESPHSSGKDSGPKQKAGAEKTKPASPGGRGTPAVPANARRAEVDSVTDGDTVVLSRTGKSRLIGVDTPEVYFGAECFGAEASSYAKSELRPGDTVRVVRGAERRDRYGRSLIYLWTDDGRFFNAELARLGYAVPLTIEPNSRFAELFRRLADQADRLHRGLWAKRTCDGDPDRSAG